MSSWTMTPSLEGENKLTFTKAEQEPILVDLPMNSDQEAGNGEQVSLARQHRHIAHTSGRLEGICQPGVHCCTV